MAQASLPIRIIYKLAIIHKTQKCGKNISFLTALLSSEIIV